MKQTALMYDKAMLDARKYWRERIASMSFDGHVAVDHPRPKDGQQRLSTVEQRLEEEVAAALRRLTAGNHFLVYTTLLLALKVCCYRYSGRPEVVILIPATVEGSVANLLPISSVLEGKSSFRDALLAAKERLSNAYKYQQYPFGRMLLDIPDERRPTHQSMIAAMAGVNDDMADSHCDIAVLFDTRDGNGKVTFRFDGRLYDESTIVFFAKSFHAILQQGLREMTTRIADLIPDDAEPDGLDQADNGASRSTTFAGGAPDSGACLHRLIEAQAAKRPEAVAVVHGDRVATYERLDRHADQLAKVLEDLALDPAKPIVILMDAGIEMIVGMLAVMKIGAAFAPVKLLSVRRPIAEILQVLDCECIICQREHLADLAQLRDDLKGLAYRITVGYSPGGGDKSDPSLEIACSVSTGLHGAAVRDQMAAGLAHDSETAIRPAAAIRNGNAGDDRNGDGRFGTACILVNIHDDEVLKSPVTHTELVRLFQWLNESCNIGPHDRCLLSPGLGACEHLYDTLGMLIAGASVEIANASGLQDTSLLARRLTAGTITVWDLPTPLMQNLLANVLALHAKRPRLPGPRSILLVGEKQCASLARRLAHCFPNAQIVGLYAHPAVAVWCTVFPFAHGSAGLGGAAVAQPAPGFEHRIVNRNGEPSGLPGKGELHLVRSPPALEAGRPSIVRTELRGQRMERGRITWLRGAAHSFVKYECCVELTEIEAALCRHEHIRAAEVVTVKPGQGSISLIAAFVVADPEQMSAETARDFLVLNGGVDIIPDRFIVMTEFPLTADGAVDRDVLTKRYMASQEAEDGEFGIEADKIHRRLKVIWLEALQLDDVDDDDSFFARGGNSLKATLLMARIKNEFSVDLSVQDFFRKPTARAVAQLIEAGSKNAKARQGPDVTAVPRERYRIQLLPGAGADGVRTGRRAEG